MQAAIGAVEEPSFLLELLVVLREYPFSKEAESLLLNTWFQRYPAHPLTLDTRARLLLEQVSVCYLYPGGGRLPFAEKRFFSVCPARLLISVSNPDSIGSVDPDSESGSGSRRAKMTHKSRKKLRKFMF